MGSLTVFKLVESILTIKVEIKINKEAFANVIWGYDADKIDLAGAIINGYDVIASTTNSHLATIVAIPLPTRKF